MPDVLTTVGNIISPMKGENPRLFRALDLILKQVHRNTIDLHPLVEQSQQVDDDTPASPSLIAPVVTHIFPGATVRFIWGQVDGAVFYEARVGDDWETAFFQFRTPNLLADIDPIAVGFTTFLFKSIDISGNYSSSTFELIVEIPEMLPISLGGSVIDNNILLSWSAPSSVFTIRHYVIYREGVALGTQFGTFFTRFEQVGGTYEYGVQAVDLFGNAGPISSINLLVNQPIDFVLFTTFISDLDGTYTDALLETGTDPDRLVAPVDIVETWEDHFINNSWDHIQDQIDAGYPIYILPAKVSGTPDAIYEEEIDFGVLIAGALTTATWNFLLYDPDEPVNIVVKMATSTDGISYSSFTSGSEQFLIGFRYITIKLEFTGFSDKSLIELWEFTVSLSLKREQDGGEVEALAADVTGTAGLFNKDFLDIESLTATVKSSTSMIVIVDFVDVPDPTGFSVYVFNSAGTRQDATVEWAARGVV